MPIAKVIEVISEGKTLDEAIESAANEAGKTVRNVKSVNVDNIQARVNDGKVTGYRAICKVTFIID